MTINIEYETDQELGIDYAALASQVADKVLEMEKCPYDGQVNLVLTEGKYGIPEYPGSYGCAVISYDPL